MSRELLQIRVNEASKCSKMEIFDFQSVVCKKCTKLEINSLHNLKASTKYYVLTQNVSGQAIQVSNDYTSILKQILQYLPDEALLEPAAATYGDRFYNKSTFSNKLWLLAAQRANC